MKLKCDSRILSKNGILLFTQRYINDCYIRVMPLTDSFYEIEVRPKSGACPDQDELQNALLECEFIAARYEATKDLRSALEEQVIRAAEGATNE